MRITSCGFVCLLFAVSAAFFGGLGLSTSAHAIEEPVQQAEVPERSEGGKSLSAHERVAGFVRLWSEAKYNFAFFDQVPELDWDKVFEEYLPKVQGEQTTEQYYQLLEQCVALLKDGHTSVFLPSDLRKNARLPFQLAMIESKVIVTHVAPAACFVHPELKTGQELTHIGGQPVKAILEQHVYPYVADSTRQNRDRHALRRLIEGDENARAIIRLRDLDGQGREVTLPYLRWRYPTTPKLEYLNVGKEIAYVSLNSFSSKDIVSQFDAAFERIRKSKGLIIDVRNNGGGSSSIGYAIIGKLINKPIKGSRWKTRQYMPAFRAWGEADRWYIGEPRQINPRTETPFLGPVVVLIGPGTASAAEDFVVALHASGRAILVGEKTAGTTGQPLVIKLPGGGSARICTKHDFYPDGREFVGIGIIPDVEVHPTQESVASGKDTVSEKALERLAERTDCDKKVLIEQYYHERHQKLAEQENAVTLQGILKRAKGAYSALSTACAKEEWNAVDRHGDDLADIIRKEVLVALALDTLREQNRMKGQMDEQSTYQLHLVELLKKEIESFFAEGKEMTATRQMFVRIEDLSDGIHDCARDGKTKEIPAHFAELERTWHSFWNQVVAKMPEIEE